MEIDLPVAAKQAELGTACKTPRSRLLYMMAGWSRYVETDEADGFTDAPGMNDVIHELYQDAGALDLDRDNPMGQEAEETIRAFVMGRVLPTLFQNQ